jgi:hypothetical protein
MTIQRVTLRLTELRCVKQSEGSTGSEPYLWVTYFAFGAQPTPFQMIMHTPAYDAFRTEFPNNMKAGQVANVPAFISTASFDIDFDNPNRLIGCIAVLMEEDETPQSSIVLGRIAYSKEIEKQLNDLVLQRVHDNNFGPITPQEIEAIRRAVKSKVEDAIGSNQGIWDFFTNQDDNVGFTYRTFTGPEIQFQFFDFPQIANGNRSDLFTLSGGLSIGPMINDPADRCAVPRAALKAKQDRISGLHTRVTLLQSQLHQAAPGQKAAIVAEIGATNVLITQAEAQLPALQASLDACTSRPHVPGGVVIDPTIAVTPH